jgi:hypothetical protein
MAILIVVLLLVVVPVLVFLTTVGSRHQVSLARKNKLHAVAEEGIAFAAQRLSASQAIWNNALDGNFSAIPECNSSNPVPSPSGGQFFLTCSRPATLPPDLSDLQPYQVNVIATAVVPGAQGENRAPYELQAYLSRRTLSVALSEGLRASAAVQLVTTPAAAGNDRLTVHWGPIVIYDPDTILNSLWTLHEPLDRYDPPGSIPYFTGFPRKFSQSGITGSAGPARASSAGLVNTDHREYWAFASVTFPPVINDDDLSGYAFLAKQATNFPAGAGVLPFVGNSTTEMTPAACATANCSYFNAPAGQPANFHRLTGDGYAAPAGSVIYVNGDATIGDMASVAAAGITLVVTGNLTIQNHSVTAGAELSDLRVPAYAAKEYAYWQPTDQWPCAAQAASTHCTSAFIGTNSNERRIHMRGFLYVKGDLNVNDHFRMAGALLVGDMGTGKGTVTIAPNTGLTVLYDDLIGHRVLTQSVELQTDILRPRRH